MNLDNALGRVVVATQVSAAGGATIDMTMLITGLQCGLLAAIAFVVRAALLILVALPH